MKDLGRSSPIFTLLETKQEQDHKQFQTSIFQVKQASSPVELPSTPSLKLWLLYLPKIWSILGVLDLL